MRIINVILNNSINGFYIKAIAKMEHVFNIDS